jgi:hypothetical protein
MKETKPIIISGMTKTYNSNKEKLIFYKLKNIKNIIYCKVIDWWMKLVS